MKRLKLIAIIILAMSGITSCNYLDVEEYFKDTLPYDSVFANKKNVERYMWATAAMFPDEGSLLDHPYTPGPLATDEAFATFNTGSLRGIGFVIGEVTPDDLRGLDNWGQMYKIIRKCNIILSRLDGVKDMTTTSKFEILGYTHFIRAYAYYHLLMNFGPVILVGDEVLNSNESPEYYDRARATYDESVEYICNEFEEAAKFLPAKVLLSQFGRPTKGAAYGLIARIRLQHASPLYNGGATARTYFGSWTRSIDGAQYISQKYDEKRWAIAAAAALRVMDMGLFSLHTVARDKDTPQLPAIVSNESFPDGAGDIDPFKSYSDMFTGESVPQTNPEYVWGRMSDGVREITRNSFNVDIMGGWNGMCIPQKVIDAFRMADGRDINNSSYDYPYSEEGMDNSGRKTFSGYILNNNISNMYANREMRFYASVGFTRRFWAANSTSETNRKNLTITYDKNGNSGRYSSQNINDDYPSTGYVITKFIHADDAWKGDGSTRLNKGFPIIRYAEILLSYTEALNNLTESHTVELGEGSSYTVSRGDGTEMAKAFNQVRYRAGLPGLSTSEINDPITMQTLIERERMIEFLFENRRYFDVRRWDIYEKTEKEPIMGMNIETAEPDYYSKVVVNHSRVRNRIVNKKMIFLPVPKYEIRKMKKLDQNPGWNY